MDDTLPFPLNQQQHSRSLFDFDFSPTTTTTSVNVPSSKRTALTLSPERLQTLLRSCKLNKECTILHPTRESTLYFDLLSGNSKWMFSEGHLYFAELVNSFSFCRVLEKTIVCEFFDNYTAIDHSHDWELFKEESKSDLLSADYHMYLSDMKRILREASRRTMAESKVRQAVTCAQRLFKRALYWHAAFNVVPCSPFSNLEALTTAPMNADRRVKRVKTIPPKYRYEQVVANACKRIVDGAVITKEVPAMQDTVVVYDYRDRKVKAFSYVVTDGHKEHLRPIDVFFFDDVSHSSFTLLPTQPFVQTHSLCETLLPIEMFIHDVEGSLRQRDINIGGKMTVIVENDKDAPPEGTEAAHTLPSAQQRKRKQRAAVDPKIDTYVSDLARQYRHEMKLVWSDVNRCIENAKKGLDASSLPTQLQDSFQEATGLLHGPQTRSQTKDRTADIVQAARTLGRKDPMALAGHGAKEAFQCIESNAEKLRREMEEQRQMSNALSAALELSTRERNRMRERNLHLFEDHAKVVHDKEEMEAKLSKLEEELSASRGEIHAYRSKLHLIDMERSAKSKNDIVSVEGCSRMVLPTEDKVHFVNVSEQFPRPIKYMNAYFSPKSLNENVQKDAMQRWNSAMRTRFYLHKEFTHTGNVLPRQNTVETTQVYPQAFLLYFTLWEIQGVVLFDKQFIQRNNVNAFFDEELQSSALFSQLVEPESNK